MTVKELIRQLRKFDPEADVIVSMAGSVPTRKSTLEEEIYYDEEDFDCYSVVDCRSYDPLTVLIIGQ